MNELQDKLLNNVICSGLQLTIDQTTEQKATKACPDNSFGVFVTVRRQQKLSKWPEDIHGCIGYWDNNYNVLSKKQLYENALRVSYDATWTDKRKDSFTKPIYQDSLSTYEIDFMMKPLLTINIQTGTLPDGSAYSNKTHGIIVQHSQGNKATYLPNVFPNQSWSSISKQLLEKAGVTEITSDVIFYAYKAVILKKKIYQLLEPPYLQFLINKFIKFNNDFYETNPPYKLKNNEVYYEPEQAVRNLSVMYDLLKYRSQLTIPVRNSILNNLEEYVKDFNNDKKDMRQASAFILLCFHLLNQNTKEICLYLYKQLPNLEKKFELGEVLVALTIVCPSLNNKSLKNVLIREHQDMYKILKKNADFVTNDVFEYNWQSKFLFALFKNKLTKNTLHTMFNRHANLLTKRILAISDKFDEQTETNYYAVAFEALCSLYFIVKSKYGYIMINKIFDLFYLLQKRMNKKGLYEFINKAARLDITGHVNNGFEALMFED